MSELISNDKKYRNEQLIKNSVLKAKELWSLKKNSASIEEQESFQKQIDSYFAIIKEEILKLRHSIVEKIPNKLGVDDVKELKVILRFLYIVWDDENLRNQFYNYFGIKNLNRLFPMSKKDKRKIAIYSVIMVILGLIITGELFWIAAGVIEKLI